MESLLPEFLYIIDKKDSTIAFSDQNAEIDQPLVLSDERYSLHAGQAPIEGGFPPWTLAPYLSPGLSIIRFAFLTYKKNPNDSICQ